MVVSLLLLQQFHQQKGQCVNSPATSPRPSFSWKTKGETLHSLREWGCGVVWVCCVVCGCVWLVLCSKHPHTSPCAYSSAVCGTYACVCTRVCVCVCVCV